MAAQDPAVLQAPAPYLTVLKAAGVLVSAVLVALTLARYGVTWQGAAWSLAQLLLVCIACFDLATRRIPNRVTLPAMAVVLALRALFTAGTLGQAVAAGAVGFVAFLLLVMLSRGGFGMGDAKLAGLLGLLLGWALLPCLFVGVVAGGLASAVVFAAKRGGRGHTIAYGPYLCFGGTLAILALQPPPLV
jgi:leader peptidase (prepilin peptidase)/N-methyltransferase